MRTEKRPIPKFRVADVENPQRVFVIEGTEIYQIYDELIGISSESLERREYTTTCGRKVVEEKSGEFTIIICDSRIPNIKAKRIGHS